ncbi:MAG: response regulator transcription factor [Actinobacteria bacterium]|nr:response regulator transcription factor [Actinomycetota bacterium]
MTAEQPIRVLVVDDHVIVRNGLEQLLGATDDYELVGLAGNGREAIDLVEQLQPDVVLMDLSMPVMEGVEATAVISERWPDTKIVVLTSFSDHQRVLSALEAGADGYVLKHADPDQILAAIGAVHRGGAPIDPQVARVLLDVKRVGASGRGVLTDREEEVLRLVQSGLANKQIGRRLGISERTVKAHLTKIFHTLGVADRTQAALWAAEHLPAAR